MKTKSDMIDEMVASMVSSSQRDAFKKRGMKKNRSYIEKLFLAWESDKTNTAFYIQLLNS